MSAAAENLLTVWARLLFASLADAGVRHVVLSPGARSTPFVLAAAAQPRLRLHDVIDERTAAFFALGQARVSGAPSVLLCTSGSAAAHYLPAVIEADRAGVPLLIVTADRPVELLHVGANQTIDQRLLFEGYARRVVDVGAPDPAPSALRGLRRLAAQSVALAMAPQPGVVHLNLRARKPLEPAGAASTAAQDLDSQLRTLLATAVPRVAEGALAAPDEAVAALARRCLEAQRGVIVAGPAPASQAAARQAVARLALATGFPLLADAASQLRFAGPRWPAEIVRIETYDWLYRLPAADDLWRPDFVLQLGEPPTSAAWERLLDRHPGIARAVVSPRGWPDPHGSAGEFVHADIATTCERLAAAVERRRPAGPAAASDFARALDGAQTRVREAIEDALRSGETLGEGAVARRTASALPAGGWLALGNSLPIRTADAYCSGLGAELRVLSQRGASGIDGLVSGAAGAASVADAPLALLVGDVSALHDIGGFALAGSAPVPLVIVIVNNGGGRIFEQLPLARVADKQTMAHFTTPHRFDFALAARLYGLAFARAGTTGELDVALAAAVRRPGCTVIEAVVAPRGAAVEQERILAALAAGSPG